MKRWAKLKPVSPGRAPLEEFLKPMGITQYRLAKEIGVPAQRIGAIVAGRRSVTADADLRLCRFFCLSDGYWLRAQAAYDTEVAAGSCWRMSWLTSGHGRGPLPEGGGFQQAHQPVAPSAAARRERSARRLRTGVRQNRAR